MNKKFKEYLFRVLPMILIIFAFIRFAFASDQEEDRVAAAKQEKGKLVDTLFKVNGIAKGKARILIVVYKESKELELWVKSEKNKGYTFLKGYSICSSSGGPGPKRKSGDRQVPEGFYFINRFNPQSSYYLSLGINYPNASDLIFSGKNNPGGDIFIHGKCVTIGCIPLTDDKIKELYLFALTAKENGQKDIPVYIFPFRMNEANLATYLSKYPDPDLHRFWENLMVGYKMFDEFHKELKYSVDGKGQYIFQ